MKTIKIILGIISAIVLAFLLTGLFVKETTYTINVSIDKPIEDVFKAFNNSENIKNWIPEVQSFEVVNNNPGKTGSIYKITVLNQGQEIVMTEKVMAYVPNEKVTLFFDAEGMLKKDDYIFTEKKGKTRPGALCVLPVEREFDQRRAQQHEGVTRGVARRRSVARLRRTVVL